MRRGNPAPFIPQSHTTADFGSWGAVIGPKTLRFLAMYGPVSMALIGKSIRARLVGLAVSGQQLHPTTDCSGLWVALLHTLVPWRHR